MQVYQQMLRFFQSPPLVQRLGQRQRQTAFFFKAESRLLLLGFQPDLHSGTLVAIGQLLAKKTGKMRLPGFVFFQQAQQTQSAPVQFLVHWGCIEATIYHAQRIVKTPFLSIDMGRTQRFCHIKIIRSQGTPPGLIFCQPQFAGLFIEHGAHHGRGNDRRISRERRTQKYQHLKITLGLQ